VSIESEDVFSPGDRFDLSLESAASPLTENAARTGTRGIRREIEGLFTCSASVVGSSEYSGGKSKDSERAVAAPVEIASKVKRSCKSCGDVILGIGEVSKCSRIVVGGGDDRSRRSGTESMVIIWPGGRMDVSRDGMAGTGGGEDILDAMVEICLLPLLSLRCLLAPPGFPTEPSSATSVDAVDDKVDSIDNGRIRVDDIGWLNSDDNSVD